MNFVMWILMGILVGWIASKIWKRKSLSIIGYLIVGVVGSFLGGLLFDIVGLSFGGFFGSLVTSVIGALLLLFILSKLKK